MAFLASESLEWDNIVDFALGTQIKSNKPCESDVGVAGGLAHVVVLDANIDGVHDGAEPLQQKKS